MRAFSCGRACAALAVSFYFALAPFAEGSAVTQIGAPDTALSQWKSVYQAAVEAGNRHSDDEALGLFERNWQTADNDAQRGLAADGLGQITRRLGRIKEAKMWLERAIENLNRDPKLSLQLAIATANLADLERSAGDYQSAEAVLQKVIDSPLCDPLPRGFIRNSLADLLREEGRTPEARRLFKETLDSPGLSARERIASLIGLADIDRQQSAWESSISQWNEALDSARRRKDEPAEAIILRGLGLTWLQSGSAARAQPLLLRSLKLADVNGELPQEEVATSHAAMAELYRAENKLALAENEWTRALAIDRPLLGEHHPQVAILMEMLSDVYSARGEFAVARDYAAQAADAMSHAFGESSMAEAAALTNQAGVEQRARNLDTAARHFARAVAIARTHPENRTVGVAMMERYAGLLKAMHRSSEAKAILALRNALLSGEPPSFKVK
jgi:tetratricopeptide (TPR) repeat protein